jgi:hypothetical protein
MRVDWVEPASFDSLYGAVCGLSLSFVDSPYFSNKEFVSLS